MQTATSETEIKSRYLSICVHHYTLRAPCPKGQGNRPLRPRVRPRRGRFGTLLQQLECGIFGRTLWRRGVQYATKHNKYRTGGRPIWDRFRSTYNTVRSRYKRQLIQLNMNKSGLYGLEWKTRDTYSLVGDSLVTRMHCTAGQVPQHVLSTW